MRVIKSNNRATHNFFNSWHGLNNMICDKYSEKKIRHLVAIRQMRREKF